MAPKKFGDFTQWRPDTHTVWHGGAKGWTAPGSEDIISSADSYWGNVLAHAREAYGDPNIHFDTDDHRHDRYLVFGDGSRLPEDGTIIYHDSKTGHNWVQNDDGTVSLVGANGKPGPPMAPSGFGKFGDNYAPVNERGEQIGPQLSGAPTGDTGFHTDPAGVKTPKNANGDYYTLGPEGKKSFFDKNNKPITEDQFNDPAKPREAGPPPPGSQLDTDEQQSGEAAKAVKKLQQELKDHYSKISAAEENLSEVLLNAHAVTEEGRKKLNAIQKEIVDASNNPSMQMDTPAGQKALLTFLRNKVGEISDLLASGALSAEDQAKTAAALAGLYAADTGGAPAPDQPGADPVPGQQAPLPPVSVPPVSADPGGADPGVAPVSGGPDPGLSDLVGNPAGMGAAPLASMLPAAMAPLSGLSGLGGASPLDGLSGLAGAGAPLAGLSSLGDRGGHDHPSDTADKGDDDSPPRDKDGKDGKQGKPDPDKPDPATQPAGEPAPGQPGEPPVPVAAPVPATAVVKLPDGSTATARSPQAAQAIRDYLGGDTVDAAYRKNGLQLPPPGTPITHPVDPSRLACGDVAVFRDHYEPVLSAVKAYRNGQVVPLGTVTSSPDFLGWLDATALAAGAAPGGAPPAAPPA
ncbi:DUF4226 domain-containing protein, partial [Mycobacterium intracellulare]|uniref:DUF4226 domain-containing protein n=1 Tax=Mycobacterium intracellulare TaxID=1767 RepID=UPI0006CA7EA3